LVPGGVVTRKSAKAVPGRWVTTLKDAVAQKPIVIFRFSEDEWAALNESRGGTNTFTIARSYSSVSNVRVPTVCILFGQEFGIGAPEVIHCGLLKSKSSNTTLERRLKIMSAGAITPPSVTQLLRLVTDKALKAIFRSRLEGKDAVTLLSPTLSVHLLDRLAQRPENEGTLRSIATAMDAPTTYSDNLSLQEDAVGLSLKAFGLSGGEPATTLTTPGDRDTSLARRGIREDSVIEHDARIVPGFTLAGSELTGRAIFRKGSEVLEVITANKRPLEEALGVDLIYLNAVKQNIVMVQYKMLEATRNEEETDWLYRPDGQLRKELSRMRLFSRNHAPGPREYRINPQVFYLRFVRRDAVLGQSAVIMPVEHFKVIQRDRACQGPKGAVRISYEALDGRYLRQEGFLELVRSGYIGAYAKTTGALTALINAVLKGDRAVVAAVQAALK
jgi:hypothetical protein